MLQRITLPDEHAPDAAQAKEDAERGAIAQAAIYAYARELLPVLPKEDAKELRDLMSAGACILETMTRLRTSFVLPLPARFKKGRAA